MYFIVKALPDDTLATCVLKHATFGCVVPPGITGNGSGVVWEVAFEHAPVAMYRPVKPKFWFLAKTTLQPGKCYKLAGPG